MWIKRALFLIFCLLLTLPVTSQSLESLDNATQAYNNGDFDNAIQFFELTISGGITNGEIFYNLGNVYYNQGDIGKALLNYRRAMQYIPRDLDLNIQIARVRSLRTTLQTDTTQWLIFLEQATETALTITELSIITFLIWSSFWILLAFYRLSQTWRNALRFPLGTLFIATISLSILLGARLYIYYKMPPAVVTVDSAPVYSGPSISYFHQYDLFIASEVYIVDEHDEWRKFVTPNNQQGWIRADAITTIVK
jgi:tetratricopeptide (TPR) repeat protein